MKTKRVSVSPVAVSAFIIFFSSLGFVGAQSVFAEDIEDSSPPHTNGKKADKHVKLEEVMVTAQRKTESLQEVPISVAVLDSDALKQRSITTAHDLAYSVPGLSGGEGLMTIGRKPAPAYSMRGHGEAFPGSPPSVVAYFAEVPEFSSFLYDLQNVQVLKGPQGTLFGKNTTGGAILVTPVVSSEELEGSISVTSGNFNQQDVEFYVGGPIVDGILGLRLSGQVLKQDGYTIEARTGEDFYNKNRHSYRATILFTPVDSFDNITLLQSEKYHENGMAAVFDYSNPQGFTNSFLLERDAYLAEQKSRGPYLVESNGDSFIYSKSEGIINKSSWEVYERLVLKNILSYTERQAASAVDGDGSSLRISHLYAPVTRNSPQETITDELQLQYENTFVQAILGV